MDWKLVEHGDSVDLVSGGGEPDCLGEASPGAQLCLWLSGYVCERKNLLANGCCDVKVPSTKQYCCEGCLVNGCCEAYEYCVSCCLQPSKVGTPAPRRFVFRASSGVAKRSFIGHTGLSRERSWSLAYGSFAERTMLLLTRDLGNERIPPSGLVRPAITTSTEYLVSIATSAGTLPQPGSCGLPEPLHGG